MTELKDEEFQWIRTEGTLASGMKVYFGASNDDPIPFILTVTPTYAAQKLQKALPIAITDLQNYCETNREELRKIAFNCKQRGLNAQVL
jgi:phage host-nuclease inhibitor protein Gam